MPIRDIRPDLRDRLAVVEKQGNAQNAEYESKRKALEDEHKAKIAVLEEEWRALKQMIEVENRRYGDAGDSAQSFTSTMSLDDFFVATVEKFGTASKKNLRDEAERAGYFRGAESAGRVTHTTLMNIVRGGRLREIAPEVYAPGNRPGEFALAQGALVS